MNSFSARRLLAGLAFPCLLMVQAADAFAQSGPPAGRYEIRTGFVTPHPGAPLGYDVLTYMILRADGSYELYYTAKNEFRSRGTFTFEPGNAGAAGSVGVVRWKSGINYDMGRGGSYFLRNEPFKCSHCILIGSNIIAVLTR